MPADRLCYAPRHILDIDTPLMSRRIRRFHAFIFRCFSLYLCRASLLSRCLTMPPFRLLPPPVFRQFFVSSMLLPLIAIFRRFAMPYYFIFFAIFMPPRHSPPFRRFSPPVSLPPPFRRFSAPAPCHYFRALSLFRYYAIFTQSRRRHIAMPHCRQMPSYATPSRCRFRLRCRFTPAFPPFRRR